MGIVRPFGVGVAYEERVMCREFDGGLKFAGEE